MTEQMQRERPRQRRRGEELEAALLQAAWDELVSVGFARLTMESVAARARTGVAVLYRRWPRKDDLVLDAIHHYGATHPVEIPDTGSLRGDMIGLLSGFSSGRVAFVAVVSAAFSGLLASTAQTYFGLNQPWNIGIAGQSASYFSAPADASGSELAEEAFGEGQLLASPLAMASVAASGVYGVGWLVAGNERHSGAREARTRNLEIPGLVLTHHPGMT